MERNEPPGPARATSGRGYQTIWLVLYWLIAAISLCSLLFVLFVPLAASAQVAAAGLFTAVTSSAATLLGATMATHLAVRGIGSVDFDDATSAMRVVVVAYAVGEAALLAIVVSAWDWTRTDLGLSVDVIASLASISQGVAAQVFGAAALFLVVGDAFTKYRRMLVALPRRRIPRPILHR